MTNLKITNPLKVIKSILTHQKRQKKYIANLEAALIEQRFKAESGVSGYLHNNSVNLL
jgi:hypothetical protein